MAFNYKTIAFTKVAGVLQMVSVPLANSFGTLRYEACSIECKFLEHSIANEWQGGKRKVRRCIENTWSKKWKAGKQKQYHFPPHTRIHTYAQTQKLLTRQFFILYDSRDRFKLGKIFLFSCAVLNRKAVFDVIWPRCQQCTALWRLFIFRFLLWKRRISKLIVKGCKLRLFWRSCMCNKQTYKLV